MEAPAPPSEEHAHAVTPLPISTRTVIERDGTTKRSLHVFCPMEERTVPIDRCVACETCKGLVSNGEGQRPFVACTFAGPATPKNERPIGTALARFSLCVRVEAIRRASPILPGTMLVIDEDYQLVGVLEPGPRVRVDAGARGLAVEEHTPLSAALAFMVRRRARYLPVVTRDGTVVGLAEDLDVMRSLR